MTARARPSQSRWLALRLSDVWPAQQDSKGPAFVFGVIVEARRTTNGPAIASDRMGSDPQAGNFYALRMAMESVPPRSSPGRARLLPRPDLAPGPDATLIVPDLR